MFKCGPLSYRLSKFVAFTAAKILVLRARPAIGMESGWLYAESCLGGGRQRVKQKGWHFKRLAINPFKIPDLKTSPARYSLSAENAFITKKSILCCFVCQRSLQSCMLKGFALLAVICILTLYRIILSVLTNVPLLSLTETAAEELRRETHLSCCYFFSSLSPKSKAQVCRRVCDW